MSETHVIADRLGRRSATCGSRSPTAATCAASYCMPEEEYVWLPREDILDVRGDRPARRRLRRARRGQGAADRRRAAAAAGPAAPRRACSPREPGLTRSRPDHQRRAARRAGAGAPRAPGSRRVTVSLDTLAARSLPGAHAARHARARARRHRGGPRRGLAGAQDRHGGDPRRQRRRAGGPDRVRAAACNAEVRFIEYMDVGGATHWSMEQVVSRRGDARTPGRALRADRADPRGVRRRRPSASALPDGTIFGIIASTTEPFCRSCDRSRLTADGMWYLCLYATAGHRSARGRCGAARRREALAALIAGAWGRRARPRRRGAAGDGRAPPARPDRRAQARSRTSRCTRAAARARHAGPRRPPPNRPQKRMHRQSRRASCDESARSSPRDGAAGQAAGAGSPERGR